MVKHLQCTLILTVQLDEFFELYTHPDQDITTEFLIREPLKNIFNLSLTIYCGFQTLVTFNEDSTQNSLLKLYILTLRESN